MAFLNPLVLIGLAAAAIPILIHLFNFRRPQRVEFPSLRFVRELERKAMRRVRLRQWLLLALRTLAILALVLAFARPTVPSAWREAFGARPPAAVALVVDNSMSMTVRDTRGEYLDQARAVAAAIADAAPAGDALAMLTTAGLDGSARLFPTPAPVLDELESITAGHGAGTLAGAAGRAASILETADQPRRDIYLISDLQSATLAESTATALPEGVRLTLVPLGGAQRSNTAVTDVRVDSRVVEPGRPVQLRATVVRWGGSAGQAVIRVFVEGEPVAERPVELRPGTPASARFTITPPRSGWLRGEVRLAEGDDFEADDLRPFTLEAPAARRVLLVRGDGRGTEYVRLALSLGAETGSVVVNEVVEAGGPQQELNAYDVVVLLGPRTLSTGMARALADFVVGGGGVLMTPHETPDEAAYRSLFGALGGGRLDGFVGTPGGPSIGGLGDIDLEHPLLAGLLADENSGRIEGPEVAHAARYVQGGGDETTIARLAAGAPFLHEIRRGRGALLFMSVAPDPRWSDLPTRGLFAPLILRAVGYLAGARTPAAAGDALVAGRPGTIRLEGADPQIPIRLVASDGVAVPTEQRAVPGAVMLDVDGVALPGVYTVRQGERTVRLVAVQPDPLESDLRSLAPEEAARRMQAATGREVDILDARGRAGETALNRRGRGAPLWSVFLVLALVSLVAETIVATRWKPQTVAA